MPNKYSKYNKHSSNADFLSIVNATPENTTPNTSAKGIDFDFTFDMGKFTYWFVLFVVGYVCQPLVVFKYLLPSKIQKAKEGKKEDGSLWAATDFNNNVENNDDTKTKLAIEANQEKTLNANQKIIGSKITSLFVIALFTFIFGNWSNNVNFENKVNLILMIVGTLASTFGLELLKSVGNTTYWIDMIERTLPMNKDFYPGLKFDFKSADNMKSIYTIASFILLIFIIPLGYGIYKSVKGGYVLYYILLILISICIFVLLPLWVKNRISLIPWMRGLAIVTLLLCRSDDKFSFLFGGLAIGIICSETHWMRSFECISSEKPAEKPAEEPAEEPADETFKQYNFII